MSLKDQLRNCFVCLWHDFWLVPPRKLLSTLGYLGFVVVLLLWRVHTLFSYPAWFHKLSPLLDLAFVLLFGYTLYRKFRTFYDEKMR